MGCRNDYLAPTEQEIETAKVLALLEELRTGKLPDYYGDGSYKKAYGHGDVLKGATPLLCSKLKNIDDVTKYSLEMQMWWRNHQEADARHKREERNKVKERKTIKKALNKLTKDEIQLLKIPKDIL